MSYSLTMAVYAGDGNENADLLTAEFQAHGEISASAFPTVALTITNDATHFYFRALNDGWHSFRCDTIPDGFSGVVRFLYSGVYLSAVISLTPQEVEIANANITQVNGVAAQLDANTLTDALGSGVTKLAPVESVNHDTMFSSMMAAMFGKTSVNTDDADAPIVTFAKRDGTTPIVAVTLSANSGERTGSAVS